MSSSRPRRNSCFPSPLSSVRSVCSNVQRNEALLRLLICLRKVFTNGFRWTAVRNEEKRCSDPPNKVENECVSEICISQGVLMQSTLPVSSNVNLFILIKWKTIERSVLVIQEKATEILCNHKQRV